MDLFVSFEGRVSIPTGGSGPEPGRRVPREHATEPPRAGRAVAKGARPQQAKGKEY